LHLDKYVGELALVEMSNRINGVSEKENESISLLFDV